MPRPVEHAVEHALSLSPSPKSLAMSWWLSHVFLTSASAASAVSPSASASVRIISDSPLLADVANCHCNFTLTTASKGQGDAASLVNLVSLASLVMGSQIVMSFTCLAQSVQQVRLAHATISHQNACAFAATWINLDQVLHRHFHPPSSTFTI